MRLTLERLIAAVTLIAVFAMAARVAIDVDTWWHLRAGAWMVEHRQILRADEFSSTAFGRPWDYPAWLAETVLYLIFMRWGYAGLNLFTAAFVTLAFALVYAACDAGSYVRAAAVILAATASAVFWSARPHIVSLALTAAVLYLLDLYRRRGINRLWFLPLLMAVWANVHPGFAVAFIIIGLTLAGEAVKALTGRTAWRPVMVLGGIGLVCVAALMLSPYGPGLLLFPFKTVSSSLLRDHLQEWQAPNFHLREAQPFLWLMLITLAAVALSRRRIDLTDLIVLGGSLYMALLAGRNVAVFALAAAPVLARHAQALVEDLQDFSPRWAAVLSGRTAARPPGRLNLALNWLVLVLVAIAAAAKISIPLDPELNAEHTARQVPVAAAAFIARSRPPGPMFNPYHWGGYLSWALYPDYLVYVDGRTDLYGDEFFAEYLRVAAGFADWDEILDRRGVRLLVVENDSPPAELAAQSEKWQQVYADAVARVYIRLSSSGGEVAD